jgi:hypothetical protein
MITSKNEHICIINCTYLHFKYVLVQVYLPGTHAQFVCDREGRLYRYQC